MYCVSRCHTLSCAAAGRNHRNHTIPGEKSKGVFFPPRCGNDQPIVGGGFVYVKMDIRLNGRALGGADGKKREAVGERAEGRRIFVQRSGLGVLHPL